MDDREDVVGAGRGERLERSRRYAGGASSPRPTGRAGCRCSPSSGRSRRIAARASSGTGGRSRPVRAREVRDERRLAGRHRHDARPAAAAPPAQAPDAGDQLGRLHAARRGRRSGSTPAASSAASVTRSSPARLPLCATAASCAWPTGPTFTARIGLPMRERVVGEREEPLRPLEALDEQHDGVRLGVVEAVGEVVAQVEHDLRAHRHDPAVPDPRPGRVDERVGHAARLGEARDVAARQPRVDVADVGGACWSSSRPCPCSWARAARSRGGSRCRATSRCIVGGRPRRPRPRRRPG